jgi:hypothetical protein
MIPPMAYKSLRGVGTVILDLADYDITISMPTSTDNVNTAIDGTAFLAAVNEGYKSRREILLKANIGGGTYIFPAAVFTAGDEGIYYVGATLSGFMGSYWAEAFIGIFGKSMNVKMNVYN